MIKKNPKLTVKQKIFVKEYIQTKGNGKQSALKAYDTTSHSTAAVIANENLNKPNVKEAIDKALQALEITPSYILGSFKHIADNSDNDMVSVRALENLADISDMYPKSGVKADIDNGQLSISWLS